MEMALLLMFCACAISHPVSPVQPLHPSNLLICCCTCAASTLTTVPLCHHDVSITPITLDAAQQRVYQYHMDTSQGVGRVTEEHILGLYDAKATAAAAKRDAAAAVTDAGRAWQAHQEQLLKDSTATKDAAADQPEVATGAAAVAGDKTADTDSKAAAAGSSAKAADSSSSSKAAADPAAAAAAHPPPMLELLDYLPDTAAMLQSHWPYVRQMYMGEQMACADHA
jgi:hypothetical protein